MINIINDLSNLLMEEGLQKWLLSRNQALGSYIQDEKLQDHVQLTSTEFVNLFLVFLRNEMQWLLQDSSSESPIRSLNSSLQSKGLPNLPKERGVDSRNPSSCKSRSRVKLFVSPNQSPSPNSSFSSSTPKTENAKSPFSGFTSPPFPSPESILSPDRVNSPNCSSAEVTSPYSSKTRWTFNNSPRVTTKQNYHRNEDHRLKSQSKFSLGDFMNESNLKKFKGRRIKPTKVSLLTPKSPLKALSLDSSFQVPESNEPNIDERLILKKECQVLQEKLTKECDAVGSKVNSSMSKAERLTSPPSLGSPVMPAFNISLNSDLPSAIKPDPEMVTDPNTLDNISHIYGIILKNNMCDNIMLELHLLLSILAAPLESICKIPEKPPLNSIHNCVYVAVETIIRIKEIIFLLNSSILSFLAATTALSRFASSFKNCLVDLARTKVAQSAHVVPIMQECNVSFQCDTDNVENFTSHLNFTSFRKQRDGFYNLLQKWEENNAKDFCLKVRAIVTIRDDTTNMVHLSRLFCHQLLASCSIRNQNVLEVAGKEVLDLLPHIDRSKLSRLEARLTVARSRRGIVPAPDFPNNEKFFHDFITCCDSRVFLHFLQRILLFELLRFNDLEFNVDGNDGYSDELTQNKYIECVTSSRLLAKFLALVQFLPYQFTQDYPKQILQIHTEIRQAEQLFFNPEHYLRIAARSHRLVITIPWLSMYAAMMDSVTINLPAYSHFWGSLTAVRRSLPPITLSGRFLLQLCLGWLFQIVVVPEILPNALEPDSGEIGLDDVEIISETVLYTICPFLEELSFVLISNGTSSARHIRPTPQPGQQPINLKKQLELRLEENFLLNQSPSTKRAIQFTTERVASSCIKSLVKDVIRAITSEIKDELANDIKLEPNKLNELLPLKMKEWERRLSYATTSAIWEICPDRVNKALPALLGCDIPPDVVLTACQLSSRQAAEKVNNWLTNKYFCDSAQDEFRKKLLSEVTGVEKEEHSSEMGYPKEGAGIPLLSECINSLREISLCAFAGELDTSSLLDSVQALSLILPDDRPLSLPTEIGLLNIVSDLFILLCIRNENAMNDGRLILFNLMRQLNYKQHMTHSGLHRILCQRNLQLVQKASAQFYMVFNLIFSNCTMENLLTAKDVMWQIEEALQRQVPQNVRDALLALKEKWKSSQ